MGVGQFDYLNVLRYDDSVAKPSKSKLVSVRLNMDSVRDLLSVKSALRTAEDSAALRSALSIARRTLDREALCARLANWARDVHERQAASALADELESLSDEALRRAEQE
jgi:hypothetical protein